MNAPRYSIVLPCYNESATLPSLFTRFSEVLKERSDIEVIFVNNGSKDDSDAVFTRELSLPNRAFARLVTVEVNQGYGFGILAGLRAATGEFIGWTHADSQYDPKIVVSGFDKISNDPDSQHCFLRGRRVKRNAFDAFFTAGMTCVSSLLLGTWLSDVNAQPKIFPKKFLESMVHPPHDFSLDLYALYLARRNGYHIIQLPVVFGQRIHGEAKGGGSLPLKWKLTKRTLAFTWQLRHDVRSGNI